MNTNKKNLNLLLALKQLINLVEVVEVVEEDESDKRYWVNPFLQRKEINSLESHLLKDVMWDKHNNSNNCKMDIEKFECLLALVDSKIKKRNTVMKCSISSRVRLAVTLRFLATGESYRTLDYLTRISRKTISKFVPEVLTSIVEILSPQYLKTPCTMEEWLAVSDAFENIWQFPHTLGVIGGKHIRIKNPGHEGSNFFNDKGFYSIALLAVVDANCRFLYIDVGGNEKGSDVLIFQNSSLYQAIKENNLELPPEEALPSQVSKTPYFLIGDDIFELDTHLMTEYNRDSKLSVPEEIFNYRLSRARKAVEMTFGSLANRFRIFHRQMEVELSTADAIIKACCVLHNFLATNLTGPVSVDEEKIELPETLFALPQQEHDTVGVTNRSRENVKNYLVTDGDVSFQWLKINK